MVGVIIVLLDQLINMHIQKKKTTIDKKSFV